MCQRPWYLTMWVDFFVKTLYIISTLYTIWTFTMCVTGSSKFHEWDILENMYLFLQLTDQIRSVSKSTSPILFPLFSISGDKSISITRSPLTRFFYYYYLFLFVFLIRLIYLCIWPYLQLFVTLKIFPLPLLLFLLLVPSL